MTKRESAELIVSRNTAIGRDLCGDISCEDCFDCNPFVTTHGMNDKEASEVVRRLAQEWLNNNPKE